jgi:hypothetical protein
MIWLASTSVVLFDLLQLPVACQHDQITIFQYVNEQPERYDGIPPCQHDRDKCHFGSNSSQLLEESRGNTGQLADGGRRPVTKRIQRELEKLFFERENCWEVILLGLAGAASVCRGLFRGHARYESTLLHPQVGHLPCIS